MMKRNFILLMLILLPVLCFSQERGWSVGIKALPEITHLMPIKDNGMTTLGGGIQLIHSLEESFSIESGVFYFNRGTEGNLKFDSFSRGVDIKFLFSYISLPILIRTKIGKVWYASAGPSIEYHLSNKTIYGDGKISKGSLAGYNRWSLGGNLAFGYEAPLLDIKEINFFIEVRMNPSFTTDLEFSSLNYGLGTGFNYRF